MELKTDQTCGKRTFTDILKSRSSHSFQSAVSQRSLGMKQLNGFYLCGTNGAAGVVRWPISYSPSNTAEAEWLIYLEWHEVSQERWQEQGLSLEIEILDQEDEQVLHISDSFFVFNPTMREVKNFLKENRSFPKRFRDDGKVQTPWSHYGLMF